MLDAVYVDVYVDVDVVVVAAAAAAATAASVVVSIRMAVGLVVQQAKRVNLLHHCYTPSAVAQASERRVVSLGRRLAGPANQGARVTRGMFSGNDVGCVNGELWLSHGTCMGRRRRSRKGEKRSYVSWRSPILNVDGREPTRRLVANDACFFVPLPSWTFGFLFAFPRKHALPRILAHDGARDAFPLFPKQRDPLFLLLWDRELDVMIFRVREITQMQIANANRGGNGLMDGYFILIFVGTICPLMQGTQGVGGSRCSI